MAQKMIDARGLPYRQPLERIKAESAKMALGDVLEVVADCATFENDVRNWCRRTGFALLDMRHEGEGAKRCQVYIGRLGGAISSRAA